MKAAAILLLAMSLPAADFMRSDLSLVQDEQLNGNWYELEMDGVDRRKADVRWVIKDLKVLEVWQQGNKVSSGKVKVDQAQLPCRMEITWDDGRVIPAVVRVADGKLLVLLGRDKSIYQCQADIHSRHPAIWARILFKRL